MGVKYLIHGGCKVNLPCCMFLYGQPTKLIFAENKNGNET